MSIPSSQSITPSPFPLGTHTFVFYVCVSITDQDFWIIVSDNVYVPTSVMSDCSWPYGP